MLSSKFVTLKPLGVAYDSSIMIGVIATIEDHVLFFSYNPYTSSEERQDKYIHSMEELGAYDHEDSNVPSGQPLQ